MKLLRKIELLVAIVFFIAGFSCLLAPRFNANILFYVCAAITTISSLVLWYQVFVKKRGITLFEAILISLFSLFLWLHHSIGYELVILIFSIYMGINAIGFGVQAILDFNDRSNTLWYDLLWTLIYMGLAIASYLQRSQDLDLIQYFVGFYLAMQGCQMILELFFFSKPQTSRFYSFRFWSALPVAIVSILPSIVLEKMLSFKANKHPIDFNEIKNDQKVNLRVFIHTGLSGDHRFGHMTLAHNGTMYSYGNYDKAEEKLFRTLGPGIFFSVNADEYINNCCIYEESTLFEYGLHLSPEQEEKLCKILQHVFASSYPWDCPLEVDLKKDPSLKVEPYLEDYSNRLWYRTHCHYRKFYGGEWKTYWILGTNCSLFATRILHSIDPAIHKSHGIVTPGEFWEYFEEAFQDPASNVIHKTWHSANEPSTLYPLQGKNSIQTI